jgi:hypothetical protein
MSVCPDRLRGPPTFQSSGEPHSGSLVPEGEAGYECMELYLHLSISLQGVTLN